MTSRNAEANALATISHQHVRRADSAGVTHVRLVAAAVKALHRTVTIVGADARRSMVGAAVDRTACDCTNGRIAAEVVSIGRDNIPTTARGHNHHAKHRSHLSSLAQVGAA